MKYIILLLVLLSSCTNVINSDEENYYIKIIPGLDSDDNGYYHMVVNRNNYQTLHKLSLSSNYGTNERIEWQADSHWIYAHNGLDFEVPVINGVSYTSEGMAYTMFAPVVELIGDTVTVVAMSEDVNDEIKIVLE